MPPISEDHDLCQLPYRELLLVPVADYRENPSFPVNEGYEAYTTIAECQKLVYDTLGHIARTKKYKHVIKVTAKWDAKMGVDTHGATSWKTGSKISEIFIDLNPIVFYYESPDQRAQTVIHESCHAAAIMLNEEDGHGPKWARLMKLCGIPAEAFSPRPLAMCWHGKCPKCKGTWAIHTKEALAKIKRGTHAAICRNCGKRIIDLKNMTPPTIKPNEWKRYMK